MKVQDHFLVDQKTLHMSFSNQTWLGFPKCAKSSKGSKAQEMTLFWEQVTPFLIAILKLFQINENLVNFKKILSLKS
jgi:hypothetical protein